MRIGLGSIVVPFLIAACADNPTAPPSQGITPHSASASEVADPLWSNQLSGLTADGSEYGIYVPRGWSGDVVFYAHGIIAPLAPVSLPGTGDWDDAGALRDALGRAGFAVAYSTYGENGYAVKEGAQRTHQLRGIFTSRIGQPRRSFLVGHSLGSQVVQQLAETYPGQYNGALAMCGVLGGTQLQTDYIAHTRTLFDYFYPGVLPGSTLDMPVVITDVVNQIQNPVLGAVLPNPGNPAGNFTGVALIAAEKHVQLAGRNPMEILTSLINALAYQAIGVNDLLARTHGHSLFDNSNTQYASLLYPDVAYAGANLGVARYTATSDALAWLDHNYEPTGQLAIPMLTLHKTQDRLVPFRHEAAYAARVAAAGASANLVQRSQDAFGHCDFAVDAVMTNFNDLVHWVDTGVRPVTQ
jgi:pimeloyl-ACP methyl ester carboxylesterase